jgi:serine protease Do
MKDFGDIAERLRRSVVQVVASGRAGMGSGIVWNPAGLILTNAHVAAGQNSQVELWDGTRLPARMVKHDRRRDLAVLQVSATGLPSASVGNSESLRAGELVIAVGNPLGFVGAVSTGVIHTVGPLAGLGTARWVQSSVRLAPGNSGGPLANARGEVIGVNTMIVGSRLGHLALAIPSERALRFLNESENADVEMGVTIRPVAIPNEKGVGLLILETRPGLPADQASLLIGDLLVGANGRRFRSVSDLEHAIETASGALSIQFRRGGGRQDRTVTVRLEKRKAAAA